MRLPLHPELVPSHIDGFVIRGDLRQSRFAALKAGELSTAAPQHHRDELELTVVLSGRALYLLEHKRVTLSTHGMLWIMPRQSRLLIEVSSNFSAHVLVWRRRVIKRVLTTDAGAPLHRVGGNDVLLKQLTQSQVDELTLLYQSIPFGRGRDVFNAGLGYALARSWLTYREADLAQPPPEVDAAVRQAAWLLRDENTPLDNVALAEACGLSANRLSRIFKRQMGTSISEFRNRQRIQRLLSELTRSAHPPSLMQLAFDVGFGSYAQFHRVFHRYVGLSPAAYVKRLGPRT